MLIRKNAYFVVVRVLSSESENVKERKKSQMEACVGLVVGTDSLQPEGDRFSSLGSVLSS